MMWAAYDELWRRGSLEHLLDPTQLEIYRLIVNCALLQFVIEAGRKLGKSWLLGIIAFEACLRHPGGRINYAAPTAKECVEITLPIMRQITELAPEDCRPTWSPSKNHWEFPNGAFIVLFGADDEATAEKGRGPESVVNIVDEGGFTPVLFYLLESVLAPQTLQALSSTGMFAAAPSNLLGRTIIASTPPISPGHDFVEIAEAAAAQKAYVHRTVYEHGRMTRAEIDAFLEQRAASRNMTLEQYKRTTDFRREYMAERVLDSTLAVVPEFPEVKEQIVVERPRPEFFDLCISGDPGMDDLTGVLFAVTDFRRAKLYIEHELLLQKANTQTIADEVAAVLLEHYPADPDAPRVEGQPRPWKLRMEGTHLVKAPRGLGRHCIAPHFFVLDDTSKRITADLWEYHQLSAAPAMKDDSEAAINVMRLEVGGLNVEIHPRCVHLVRQLGTAVRKAPGGDMARSRRDGHFDLVAAAKYLIRHWDKRHSPWPPNHGFDAKTQARRELPPPVSLGDVVLRGTSLGRRR